MRRTPVLPICLSLLLAFAGTAVAERSHATLRGFYPTGEFDFVGAPEGKDVSILFSQRAAAYLLVPKGAESIYVLNQRQRTVSKVAARTIRRENGDVDLPESATPQAVGRFELKQGDIVVTAPDLRGRLTPRGPALGTLTAADLWAHSPQYGLVARAYRPDERALATLRAASGVEVEVVFGSWCPRCQQTIGNALRVQQEIGEKGVVITFYGLPKPPAAWKHPRFVSSQAKALPTAVVKVGGAVRGRIGPSEWNRFDVALAKLLGG